MAHIKDIELTDTGYTDRIQGVEFLDGTLYLSYDIHDNGTIKTL